MNARSTSRVNVRPTSFCASACDPSCSLWGATGNIGNRIDRQHGRHGLGPDDVVAFVAVAQAKNAASRQRGLSKPAIGAGYVRLMRPPCSRVDVVWRAAYYQRHWTSSLARAPFGGV